MNKKYYISPFIEDKDCHGKQGIVIDGAYGNPIGVMFDHCLQYAESSMVCEVLPDPLFEPYVTIESLVQACINFSEEYHTNIYKEYYEDVNGMISELGTDVGLKEEHWPCALPIIRSLMKEERLSFSIVAGMLMDNEFVKTNTDVLSKLAVFGHKAYFLKVHNTKDKYFLDHETSHLPYKPLIETNEYSFHCLGDLLAIHNTRFKSWWVPYVDISNIESKLYKKPPELMGDTNM